MGAAGWVFGDSPGAGPDTVNGATRLYEVYLKADPHYTGRVTVPVLWEQGPDHDRCRTNRPRSSEC